MPPQIKDNEIKSIHPFHNELTQAPARPRARRSDETDGFPGSSRKPCPKRQAKQPTEKTTQSNQVNHYSFNQLTATQREALGAVLHSSFHHK